eukprot:6463440-Amphidinium_carterae.1
MRPNVDLKVLQLMPKFSGRDENYAEWEVRTRSLLSLLGADGLLTAAEAARAPRLLDMDEHEQALAKSLYHMLLQATSGKALTLVMAGEPLNGAAAWASLKREFRLEIASRHNAMLMGLLNPQFNSSRPFHEQLAEWKRRIAEYERATSKQFEDDTKIAVLTHAAPGSWRAVVIAAAA